MSRELVAISERICEARLEHEPAEAQATAKEGELLRDLAGVRVDAKRVERSAAALGAEMAADEQHQVHVAPDARVADTMYLGMDGTGVPMRASELEGRAGKQPDGTAKTREVKLCAIWSAEGRDATGMAVREPGSVSYNAAIESVATSDTGARLSPFAKRVGAAKRGAAASSAPRGASCSATALRGSGSWARKCFWAPSRSSTASMSNSTSVTSPKPFTGPPKELGQPWAKERHAELDAGHIDAIQQALTAHVKQGPEARRCHEYLATNRQCMRYPEFHAQGLCTSAGVLEAGCRAAPNSVAASKTSGRVAPSATTEQPEAYPTILSCTR